jgi:GrpB-like predicted nucleotidyltransferase (UPF0157 family)
MFEEKAAQIAEILSKDLVVDIEYISSTAVPELAEKPIIDLLASAHALVNAKQFSVSPLEKRDYLRAHPNAAFRFI